MTPIHIRTPDHASTLCGSEGGSISLRHYAQQIPHIRSLPICQACADAAMRYGCVAMICGPDIAPASA